ncbi:hypothetical protein BUALT_Bualt07G0098700 [Buddleja alternifolia]|uniref:Uncharacterized protein n=1 Tax=Buddleja alternifolia TaxID=168488 RepID=A0AAV6XG83_9LAMI|nr:hypothetical protein BUALT_Bualt07G0098700 [Buddleja alternifolia]
MLASVTQEIEELFMLPKPQQLFDNTLEKKELVAAFINFLVQLLSHGVGLIFSSKDRINNLKEELRFLVVVLGDTSLLGATEFEQFLTEFEAVANGNMNDFIFPFDDSINNLNEELRCLVLVLRDTSLLGAAAEIEQMENLLAEFEAVANKAGSLVYSLFFAPDLIDGTSVGALFEQIDLLKPNIIINFSNLLPPSSIIKTDTITPAATAVDSFSIIVSLLRDLKELIMNDREDDLIVYEIKILHQGLMLFQSFLKDINVLRLSEIGKVVMRIRDVVYESEYLINSFLVGDAPLWYLNIRIPTVIHKIKLIEIGIQDIEKNYDIIGALKVAKDFSAQLSLQAK